MIEQFYLTSDGTLKGTTAPGQSEPESNGNELVLYFLQSPRLEPHHQMQNTKYFQVLVSNTNSSQHYSFIYSDIWFQVLLSNTNNSI